jgi:hypothetical protein
MAEKKNTLKSNRAIIKLHLEIFHEAYDLTMKDKFNLPALIIFTQQEILQNCHTGHLSILSHIPKNRMPTKRPRENISSISYSSPTQTSRTKDALIFYVM